VFRLSQDAVSKSQEVSEPASIVKNIYSNQTIQVLYNFEVARNLSRILNTLSTFPVPAYANDISVTSQYFPIFSSNVLETSAVASTLS